MTTLPEPLGAGLEVCPVPPNQRPLAEYRQLQQSWFFAWPDRGTASLTQLLLLSWSLALPPSLLVAWGSYPLRQHLVRWGLVGATAALLLPLLLLLRQGLGWRYVQRRLLSERVTYEESGWYDGQVWEKPVSWCQQDRLVAQHQVTPVLIRLRQAALVLLGLLLLGTGFCQAL